MTYRVFLQRLARADLAESYDYAARRAPLTAQRWLDRFQRALGTLARNPQRCPFAHKKRQGGTGTAGVPLWQAAERFPSHLHDRRALGTSPSDTPCAAASADSPTDRGCFTGGPTGPRGRRGLSSCVPLLHHARRAPLALTGNAVLHFVRPENPAVALSSLARLAVQVPAMQESSDSPGKNAIQRWPSGRMGQAR
jgi:plasmid stabilization system protein ParE